MAQRERPVTSLRDLTPRQQQIAWLVAEGWLGKEIAAGLVGEARGSGGATD